MKTKPSIMLAASILTMLSVLNPSPADPTATEGEMHVVAPNARTTGIVVRGRAWTINDLNQIAAFRLAKSNKVSLSIFSQVTVSVQPQDTTNMCVFRYSSGFDSPVWTVKFGYDGNITSVEKRMLREGK